jgi:hypothetical protein
MQMRSPGEGGGDDGDYDGGDGGDGGGEDGDPGPGGTYRRLAVVKAIPLQEGEELPTHSPTHPGKLVIVKSGKRQGALGWLEKESDIPHTRETPGTGGPEAQRAGHWVPVEPEEGEDEAEFAYVFHVDESFGKQGATPQPQPTAGVRR